MKEAGMRGLGDWGIFRIPSYPNPNYFRWSFHERRCATTNEKPSSVVRRLPSFSREISHA
jgi:hypothetical protein